MSNGWDEIPLKEIAQPVTRPVPVEPGVSYRTIGVRWWGMGAYERETIDGSRTAAKTLSTVRVGDLIINKIWVRHGSVAIAKKDVDGCAGSGEFPTFELDLTRVDSRWIHWQTKMKSFWEKCDDLSRGTSGKNRIKPELFLTIKIPLPPIPEQQRIVARIEAIAQHVEEARELRQKAAEEAEAFINSAARQLLSLVEGPITDLRNWLDESRNGIQTGPFGAQLGSDDFVDSGVPVVTIGNVQHGGLKTENLKYVTTDKATHLGRFRIKAGDVLFARMGTVGRACIAPDFAEDWLFNYHIIRVALDINRIEPRYVHWLIRASADIDTYLGEKIRGATRQGVNSDIVGSLPCRVPQLTEQRRIVAYLDGLQAKVDELKRLQAQTQKELDALMPSVLVKAFAGEL